MNHKVSVVVPASGAGIRLGGDVPKQFLPLDGKPILKRTLDVFDTLDFVEDIAVAIPTGYESEVRAYGIKKLRYIVSGAATRAHSVYAALHCLKNHENIVIIHDGVRPFVTPEIIKSVVEATIKHGAAIVCVPMTDTVKIANENNQVQSTPNRENLWRAQTPQGFTYPIITRAYAQAQTDDILSKVTDDSALVERIGISVQVVEGSNLNIKITTPIDLILANALLHQSKLQ
ncbi:MAG: 2-C-methyl-D-erythritol 4-phosphate cytidylyltransferase [Defluviitaleaceae bacterium]|nr:2-C-methyl-D-erythritol 4-phosphate cytidylyltransferase [Defluviitaleaceae bacterium]